MELTVRIPDDLAGRLIAAGGDLSHRMLEAFVREEYAAGRVTRAEACHLLGVTDPGFDEPLATEPQSSGDDSVAAAARRLATFGNRHGLSLGGLTIKELLRESRP